MSNEQQAKSSAPELRKPAQTESSKLRKLR